MKEAIIKELENLVDYIESQEFDYLNGSVISFAEHTRDYIKQRIVELQQ